VDSLHTTASGAAPGAPALTLSEVFDWIPSLPEDDLAVRMGIEILEVCAERIVGRMPVAGNRQIIGLLHGGASAVLIETLGSLAAQVHAGPGKVVLGVDVSATHHRGVRDGWVTAVGTALQLGRTTASYLVEITDEQGRRVCTGRLIAAIREARD
jgi:uncharacterized protein (TIGR00369 family)